MKLVYTELIFSKNNYIFRNLWFILLNFIFIDKYELNLAANQHSSCRSVVANLVGNKSFLKLIFCPTIHISFHRAHVSKKVLTELSKVSTKYLIEEVNGTNKVVYVVIYYLIGLLVYISYK